MLRVGATLLFTVSVFGAESDSKMETDQSMENVMRGSTIGVEAASVVTQNAQIKPIDRLTSIAIEDEKCIHRICKSCYDPFSTEKNSQNVQEKCNHCIKYGDDEVLTCGFMCFEDLPSKLNEFRYYILCDKSKESAISNATKVENSQSYHPVHFNCAYKAFKINHAIKCPQCKATNDNTAVFQDYINYNFKNLPTGITLVHFLSTFKELCYNEDLRHILFALKQFNIEDSVYLSIATELEKIIPIIRKYIPRLENLKEELSRLNLTKKQMVGFNTVFEMYKTLLKNSEDIYEQVVCLEEDVFIDDAFLPDFEPYCVMEPVDKEIENCYKKYQEACHKFMTSVTYNGLTDRVTDNLLYEFTNTKIARKPISRKTLTKTLFRVNDDMILNSRYDPNNIVRFIINLVSIPWPETERCHTITSFLVYFFERLTALNYENENIILFNYATVSQIVQNHLKNSGELILFLFKGFSKLQKGDLGEMERTNALIVDKHNAYIVLSNAFVEYMSRIIAEAEYSYSDLTKLCSVINYILEIKNEKQLILLFESIIEALKKNSTDLENPQKESPLILAYTCFCYEYTLSKSCCLNYVTGEFFKSIFIKARECSVPRIYQGLLDFFATPFSKMSVAVKIGIGHMIKSSGNFHLLNEALKHQYRSAYNYIFTGTVLSKVFKALNSVELFDANIGQANAGLFSNAVSRTFFEDLLMDVEKLGGKNQEDYFKLVSQVKEKILNKRKSDDHYDGFKNDIEDIFTEFFNKNEHLRILNESVSSIESTDFGETFQSIPVSSGNDN